MALEDGDYGGVFGMSDFLDPAMGRVMAENPEALIPHFAAAGVPPPGPQFAENFGPRFDAAFPPAKTSDETPFIPSSGTVGDQNALSFAPNQSETPAQRSIMDSLRSGYEKATAPPGTSGPNRYLAPPPVPLPPPRPAIGSPKAEDRVAASEPGKVPPEALGKSEPVAEEPYTPSPRLVPYTVAEGAPGVSADAGGEAALPSRDPRKPAPPEDAKTSEAAKLVGALAGVRAPPAPPQPQLRPFAGERPGAQPANNALVSLLTQVLAGSPGAANALRLGTAVGGGR